MKVCVVQPAYSMNERKLAACEDGLFSLLDKCDETLDLIVLPEYGDNLANTSCQENFLAAL
jgi:hypothetical protein